MPDKSQLSLGSSKKAAVSEKVHDSELPATGLTRKEILSTAVLGLAVAAVAVAIAVLAGKREAAAGALSLPDRPRQLTHFHLLDRTGRSITEADLLGRFLVVNFVFTSCSLSCRAVNDRMEEIQRLVADRPDVRLVSLTVDPRTDTPSMLARFANEFHADTNRWLFLTGEKAALYHLIETSFISSSPEFQDFIPGGFSGTDRIMLMDPQGNVCGSFNGLKRTVAGAVASEIEKRRNPYNRQ